jgi:hypothetical protein
MLVVLLLLLLLQSPQTQLFWLAAREGDGEREDLELIAGGLPHNNCNIVTLLSEPELV